MADQTATADLQEALRRTQSCFEKAKASTRFRPPEGDYNCIFSDMGPLTAKPSQNNPQKMVVQQTMSFTIQDPSYADKVIDPRFFCVEGSQYGSGEEWKHMALLVSGQEPKTITEANDILKPAVGKVRFRLQVRYDKKDYMKIRFIDASAVPTK